VKGKEFNFKKAGKSAENLIQWEKKFTKLFMSDTWEMSKKIVAYYKKANAKEKDKFLKFLAGAVAQQPIIGRRLEHRLANIFGLNDLICKKIMDGYMRYIK